MITPRCFKPRGGFLSGAHLAPLLVMIVCHLPSFLLLLNTKYFHRTKAVFVNVLWGQSLAAFFCGRWDNFTFIHSSIWEFGHVLGHFGAAQGHIRAHLLRDTPAADSEQKSPAGRSSQVPPRWGRGMSNFPPFPAFYIFTFGIFTSLHFQLFQHLTFQDFQEGGSQGGNNTFICLCTRQDARKKLRGQIGKPRNAQLPKLQFARNGGDQRQRPDTVVNVNITELFCRTF